MANPEVRTLEDLGPLKGDKPLTHIHELTANSYITVRPLGIWERQDR